jgi:hypothetical protein
MRTPLTHSPDGGYHHARLGVDIANAGMRDFPWQLSSAAADGGGVVLARTLADARAFLHEVEDRLDCQPDTLLAIHRYLFPERYANVPTFQWQAGTIEEVANLIEGALANDPRAHL